MSTEWNKLTETSSTAKSGAEPFASHHAITFEAKMSSNFSHFVLRKFHSSDVYLSEFLGTFLWVFTLCILTNLYCSHEAAYFGHEKFVFNRNSSDSNSLKTEEYKGVSFLETSDGNTPVIVFPTKGFSQTEPSNLGANANVVMNSNFLPLSYASITGPEAPSLQPCVRVSMLPAVGVGIVLGILLYSLTDISGGHFNPVVTYAWWLVNAVSLDSSKQKEEGVVCPNLRIDSVRASLYIAFQYIGAITGCSAGRYLSGHDMIISPVPTYGVAGAFASEFIGTCLLVYVLLSLASTRRLKQKGSAAHNTYGAVAGITFILLATLFGRVSFGGPSLNPALASSVISSYLTHRVGYLAALTHWIDILPYWLGPYSGATMAFLLYSGNLYSPREVLRRLKGCHCTNRTSQAEKRVIEITDEDAFSISSTVPMDDIRKVSTEKANVANWFGNQLHQFLQALGTLPHRQAYDNISTHAEKVPLLEEPFGK